MLFVNNAIVSNILQIKLTFPETKLNRFTSAQDGFVDFILDRGVFGRFERKRLGSMDFVVFLVYQLLPRHMTYHDINTARRVQLVVIHICSHGVDERNQPITQDCLPRRSRTRYARSIGEATLV